MSTRDQLNSYIRQLQNRLRLAALLRGGAILTSVALVATVILVLISNAFAFSSGSVTGARIALFIAIAFAAGFGLALPLYGLNPRRTARHAEDVFPEFQQRLVTMSERGDRTGEPFLDLLAADTLDVARKMDPSLIVSPGKLMAFLGAGAVSLGILIWMIAAGPGYLGHGAALLWIGAPRGSAPFYSLQVTPGNATVRRNTSQMVTAQVTGLQTDRVSLYARYQSGTTWQKLSMQHQAGGSGFQFTFAGLPENVEYYVAAGPLRSRHYQIRVIDLPAVKQIRVTYHYPSWTGLRDSTGQPGGDLHAIQGSVAHLQIQTDHPLRDGLLVLDGKQTMHLSGGAGNLYTGTIHIEKDGTYHVAMLDGTQPVRLSNDFFIDAQKANPPLVRINRPGGDYLATPIEEVTVAVHADDAFGLKSMRLHYSVDGGPDKTVALLPHPGVKQADASTVLSLENFKLVPGDVVSIYATARDAHEESHTDMYFIEAQPFEREYSQSQQMGGGGGMGGQGGQFQISQRQKEIIAATWRQRNQAGTPPKNAAETARFLSEVQAKLRDQALSLAGRLQRRELTQQNQEFSDFQKDMNAAAEAMGPAAKSLRQQKWQTALPNEQKALQNLLRAEATFRRIEVAFGSRGGGAGGGAGRDLASLFDLELDTEKNQYETQQTASSANQRSSQIDQALQKLDQLARREQKLAQPQNNPQQLAQQRWQQDMLRRQAEELRRQLEQMAQNNMLSGQQGSSSASSSGQSSSGQAAGEARIRQALDRLRQATDDMSRAASSGQTSANAQRAANRLREASSLLGGMQQQQAAQRLGSLSRQTNQLASTQREQAKRMRRMFGPNAKRGGASAQDQDKLARDRAQTAANLSQLENQMQEEIRNLASADPAAAARLRDALGNAQQSDLEMRLQRSANWIRQGMGAYSNRSEPGITSDMQRMAEQVRQADQALGGSQPDGQQQQLESELYRVDRLRSQIDALSRSVASRNSGNQTGQQGRNGQPNPNGNTEAAAGGSASGRVYGGAYGGYNGGWDGLDRYYGGQMPPPNGSPVGTRVSPDRAYRDAIRELNALRQSLRGQPVPLANIEELMREMQRYDPSRLPGNLALLDQLHNQVLATVDKVELQLRRQLDQTQQGQVRTGGVQLVPQGYENAVADYFRRLSKKQSSSGKN